MHSFNFNRTAIFVSVKLVFEIVESKAPGFWKGTERKCSLMIFNLKGGGAILRDPLFFHSDSHPKRSLKTTLRVGGYSYQFTDGNTKVQVETGLWSH